MELKDDIIRCVCVCFRQEADGKLYVRYQVIGRNHVAVPTHFFKVSLPDDVTCMSADDVTSLSVS